MDQLCFEPSCFPIAESRNQAPWLKASKANRKRQAGECSANPNATLNFYRLAMLYVDGLVDNDRLPTHNDRAMFHRYRLSLVDHVLGFRSEFPTSDDSCSDSQEACDLAREFHGSKKQGWFGRGISTLHVLTLTFLPGCLSGLPHK